MNSASNEMNTQRGLNRLAARGTAVSLGQLSYLSHHGQRDDLGEPRCPGRY